MKNLYKSFMAICLTGVMACTGDFDEINKRPDAISEDEASAKYFLTNAEFELFGPGRFAYWRGPLLHGDRFAGYFTLGFNGCWWSDGLSYTYNGGYTDATYDWLAGYMGKVEVLLNLTAPGAAKENQYTHAVAKIIKALYFSKFTDIFGELPFSEAGDLAILTPKFDTQEEIYRTLINDLDEAMDLIGNESATGQYEEDITDNDVIYNGDLQKWKKLANTLKLKLGTRALGAQGADFAETAITEALASPLLETSDEDAMLPKDTGIDQYTSGAYGDVWHNFGGTGSKWHMGGTLISLLRDNDDPRLSIFAKPAAGGSMTYRKPANSEEENGWNFLLQTLDDAGVVYTTSETADEMTLSFAENTYYVGQPTRLNGVTDDFINFEMFSTPSDWIISPKGGDPISPELILTSADAYFMRAQAVVNGIASGNANDLYQQGIARSMEFWGVDSREINDFITNSPMGSLSGTTDEMLEKINIQRWIANYTNGFEGWAIVRKSGYPAELANGVTDNDIFSMGDTNGGYPQRMRYGNSERDKNGDSLQEAVSRQGADSQGTVLWWAKD